MKKLGELTYSELRDNFLSDHYSSDTDECVEAINALHESLSSIDDLIPLLLSESRVSQEAATYIAAQEGDRACSIFPHVFKLLESPWVEVRDEVCDCFIDCATKAEQFIALFKRLDDPEQCIRLRVINVISGLKNTQIDMIFEHINSRSGFDDIGPGVGLLHEQKQADISFEVLKAHMIEGTKITKLFAYAVGIKEKSQGDLSELVRLSGVPDVLRHYEIYFND